MTMQAVREFLLHHAPDIEVVEKPVRTATVAEAAAAHGVAPAQIAKTLSLWLGPQAVLLVLAGDARIDNRKFKDRFGSKPKMLAADEVEQWTGHAVGGVCPFGLSRALPVYADVSLQRFAQVLPAAGSTRSALRIEPRRLAELTRAQWVDVAALPA